MPRPFDEVGEVLMFCSRSIAARNDIGVELGAIFSLGREQIRLMSAQIWWNVWAFHLGSGILPETLSAISVLRFGDENAGSPVMA